MYVILLEYNVVMFSPVFSSHSHCLELKDSGFNPDAYSWMKLSYISCLFLLQG